jgi:hypothetical protein
MRDFRDAKAMAQTLREALNAKSVSITHAEALELIAKILGCRDWNALAARIQSGNGQTAPPAEKLPSGDNPTGQPARQKIALDAAILEDYAGLYQLEDSAVFRVTREADHLLAQLTGQKPIAFYAQGPTEFFTDVVDAQITFVRDRSGPATSVILHQSGGHFPMHRVDAVTARQIEGRLVEKVKAQTATPGTEAALRRLIDGIISGKPNYDEMGAALADATRQQLESLQSGLAELHAVASVRFLGVDDRGNDVYSVRHENGASHWRIALDSKGTIVTAWVTPGP